MLDCRIAAKRDMKFCKWLQQLSANNGDDAEEEPLDEEEFFNASGGCIENSIALTFLTALTTLLARISLIRRWWTMVTSSIEVTWLFYNTIWYYRLLYGGGFVALK